MNFKQIGNLGTVQAIRGSWQSSAGWCSPSCLGPGAPRLPPGSAPRQPAVPGRVHSLVLLRPAVLTFSVSRSFTVGNGVPVDILLHSGGCAAHNGLGICLEMIVTGSHHEGRGGSWRRQRHISVPHPPAAPHAQPRSTFREQSSL